MKVGDLVMWKTDGCVGIIIQIRDNGDCRVRFWGIDNDVFLVNQSGFEVIS